MHVLALETSTDRCSAALLRADGALFVEARDAGHAHSSLLLPMVDRVLRAAGVARRGLGAVAFGEGPGSFTGLRIACGVAQGIAFGLGVPVVGVGTLEAMAEAVLAARPSVRAVIAGLDARMGQVYLAAYRREGERWQDAVPPGLHDPAKPPRIEPGPWLAAGSAFAAYPDLGAALGVPAPAVDAGVRPDAGSVARLAARALDAGAGRPAAQAHPVYLRDKVALDTREQARLRA